LTKRLEQGASKQKVIRKVAIRVITLLVLGIIYNGGLSFEGVRFASVLGQIGIAYMIASLIFVYSKGIKQQLFWMAGILAGYSALQLLFPVSGFGRGVLTPEGSINSWIDQMLIPGKLYRPTYDPEGILCSLSASFLTLTGVVTGGILRSKAYSGNKKTLILVISGAVFLLVAILLSSFYPIIKRLWTSTFNLACATANSLSSTSNLLALSLAGFFPSSFE